MRYTTGVDMRTVRFLALGVLGAILVGGCTQKQAEAPKPEPAPLSEDAVAAYRKKHPEALIGRVVAVRSEDRLVSVGDVPVVDFKRGDAVTFLGSGDERGGNGDVVDVVKERLIVRYGEGGGREPRVGDLVVRFR